MSIVRRWHLPSQVLCGDPPKRLVSKLDVYVTGAVVGHGVKALQIVFPSWADALRAVHSSVEDAQSWYGEEVETSAIPCLSCNRVVNKIVDHRPFCSVRKAFEQHHRGGLSLSDAITPAVVEETPRAVLDRALEEDRSVLPEYPMEPSDDDAAPLHAIVEDFISDHVEAPEPLSTDPVFLKSLQEYAREPVPEDTETDPHMVEGFAVEVE